MQFGALPVRLRDGEPVVLLVTSRDTGRWVIPKGWPMPGRSREQAAATEAFEEAGLRGSIIGGCLGGYSYWKQYRARRMLCTVDVFLFRVDAELSRWPEKRQRLRHWFTPEEAATLVEEQVLADLIREVPRLFPKRPSSRRDAAKVGHKPGR
jgi:8-oxo-dGTP pyrophosphatase MutT (NUDIX family)